MEASIALSGQVAGRIDAVKPVAQIIGETMAEFNETVAEIGARYGVTPAVGRCGHQTLHRHTTVARRGDPGDPSWAGDWRVGLGPQISLRLTVG